MTIDAAQGHKPDETQPELSSEDLDAQAAVELPDREAMTLIQPDPIMVVPPLDDPSLGPLPSSNL
jgi:hypothetical protein